MFQSEGKASTKALTWTSAPNHASTIDKSEWNSQKIFKGSIYRKAGEKERELKNRGNE